MSMNLPTQEQVEAAKRLGVSLKFDDTPLTIAKLIELVEQLQYRIAALEQEKRGWSLRR